MPDYQFSMVHANQDGVLVLLNKSTTFVAGTLIACWIRKEDDKTYVLWGSKPLNDAKEELLDEELFRVMAAAPITEATKDEATDEGDNNSEHGDVES